MTKSAQNQVAAPVLYQYYEREQVLRFVELVDDDAAARTDRSWVVAPGGVVCFADTRSSDNPSYFSNARTFEWMSDGIEQVPEEVIGPEARQTAIHLFVRCQGASTFVYAGALDPTYVMRSDRLAATFALETTLDGGVWESLGGPPATVERPDSVDTALDRLSAVTTVEQRLDVLRHVVEYWHGPIGPSDGLSEQELAGHSVPFVLAWWYRWAGRRREILTGQNRLYSVTDTDHPYWVLRELDGLTEFYVENQYVYQWAIPHDDDEDPQVYGRYEANKPWEPEGVRLSEHLIMACIFEAVTCHSPYGAWHAGLDPATFSTIARVIQPISIGAWQWCGPTRFYARNGAFMYAMTNGADYPSVFIGAKTREPLAFLESIVDETWDHCAI